ncbi:hypothetical protein Agub_g5542 [Astrephomene gubernaculifera]|uniref:BZIP domain-containing protein n=1 Tax=Astrephomene gubernaculifera TaxID=47775 RepID=A0AAD3HK66_9CHLO|nr:hypothetical protein Agub_g5542 [Astrephomene gubernaculifera]
MEDVLKLLAAGVNPADVTPFTFPAGLLGGGPGPALGAANLDLALALQAGSFPSFLMGSLGSGGGPPLPLPQALALPSLELPKLLSLDVGGDAGAGPMARAAAAAAASYENGEASDGSGDNPPLPPHRSRAQGRQLQQLQQQLPQFEPPPSRQAASSKRDLDQPSPLSKSKRQALSAAEAMVDLKADALQSAAAAAAIAAAAAEAERAEARAEAWRNEARRADNNKQQQQQHADGSNSDGSDTTSESAGAAPPRSAPGRARRPSGNKDPVARAQMRQLKKRDLNREAQRRFRDRQKAALALLESTTQSQQREIEALRLTNKLLEEQYRVLMEQYKALQLRFVTMQMKSQSKV